MTSLPVACGQGLKLCEPERDRGWGGVGEWGAPSLGLEAKELDSDVDSDYDPRQVPGLSVPQFPCPNFRLKNRI